MPDGSPTDDPTAALPRPAGEETGLNPSPATGGESARTTPEAPSAATTAAAQPARATATAQPARATATAEEARATATAQLGGADDVGAPEFGLARSTAAAGDKAGFRLAAFGAFLIVVLFAGYGIGRLNNSTTSASAPPMSGVAGTTGTSMPGMAMDESRPHSHNTDGTVTQGGAAPTTAMGAAVGGLSLSSGGLTLVPTTTTFTAGQKQRLSFRIVGAGGAPVTTYAIVHEKLLHLIVIRRDLSGFQHLHPSMAADGTWGIDLTLAQPGIYRMIADFTAVVGGTQIATTLGSDLTVAGNYLPIALPAPVKAVAADGFAVGYEGEPSTKSTQPMLFGVAGPDRKPAVLEPYLGAFGHLVVLRAGDLAYVHVHPEAQPVDGKVKFWLSVPSGGTYRMFFDFQVAGQVHTAAWTVEVS
ncbi:hypothetical protein GCM10010172_15410 [Paractinoplanes ferrugineus]|uniref:Secreted protein n=1 Tax=Paractinoplanes ferrugineus TaxID=113564 RepID=A0A919IWB3_9ACTN|nr:hypothetical protein [Actinoplanes ferrugineus]GIE10105.1 hypothetical protein Afe05nite_19450 [Actinoplanes ferrugineus]